MVADVKETTNRHLLQIDEAEFRDKFNRAPFVIGHRLSQHPLFQLPRLIELAKRLPQSYVEYNAGNIPVSIEHDQTPHTGLSAEETIHRIEEHCSWMVLKRVEQDPEYNELLDQCLDEIQVLSEPLTPGMSGRAGAIFISSPGSVTPYHIDPECNFLLQIRGSKTLSVFDKWDRVVLPEEELEKHFLGDGHKRNILFDEANNDRAQMFTISEGEALHVPTLAPHYVRNGPAVSISFSVAFMTREYDQSIGVHTLNARLRRMGLKPAPRGQSPLRDNLKYNAFRAARRVGIIKRAMPEHH